MSVIEKVIRHSLPYFTVPVSFCLGRCSLAKMSAFFHEYTRFEVKNVLKKLGIKATSPAIYNGKKILDRDETTKLIGDAIEHGEPFMAGRFGSGEINAVWRVRDDGKGFIAPFSYAIRRLNINAGFFPKDKNLLPRFAELMKWATSQVNLMGVWFNPMEEYILRTYGKNPEYCGLGSLSVDSFPTDSWTAKLEGKKVLIIHPFYKSIPYQYARRELLFPGRNILPKFELIMQRAVQTIAGNKDPRFNNWFEALEYMYNEAMSKDFDVAIIGCGAYGFPLAAKIKAAGKIAIHLGGATQIMFGIMGKRWEKYKLFNENWIRPFPEETPDGIKKVEDGCYW